MEGNHLLQNSGLDDYTADDIVSRYWEARCRMVKNPSTGIGWINKISTTPPQLSFRVNFCKSVLSVFLLNKRNILGELEKVCAAFHSRQESITGESPTSFPDEDTTMPNSGLEHKPIRLQAESHIRHTGC
ncbi:hypothetical protein TNCV_2210271 [Trichonephila clavipes]|nr:hypothetical protein TNCV_2210271 [Trichonephila clavipes]